MVGAIMPVNVTRLSGAYEPILEKTTKAFISFFFLKFNSLHAFSISCTYVAGESGVFNAIMIHPYYVKNA
jgi:hypothetical protein